MAEKTLISWAHHTLNFWLGCDKVAPECSHCYFDRILLRQGREPWEQLYKSKTWTDAAKWEKKAAAAHEYRRVFTCSLSDFFHVKADEWRPDAWQVIKSTPHLIYLVLTKRPDRILNH